MRSLLLHGVPHALHACQIRRWSMHAERWVLMRGGRMVRGHGAPSHHHPPVRRGIGAAMRWGRSCAPHARTKGGLCPPWVPPAPPQALLLGVGVRGRCTMRLRGEGQGPPRVAPPGGGCTPMWWGRSQGVLGVLMGGLLPRHGARRLLLLLRRWLLLPGHRSRWWSDGRRVLQEKYRTWDIMCVAIGFRPMGSGGYCRGNTVHAT